MVADMGPLRITPPQRPAFDDLVSGGLQYGLWTSMPSANRLRRTGCRSGGSPRGTRGAT
jgi:hypothetical protein